MPYRGARLTVDPGLIVVVDPDPGTIFIQPQSFRQPIGTVIATRLGERGVGIGPAVLHRTTIRIATAYLVCEALQGEQFATEQSAPRGASNAFKPTKRKKLQIFTNYRVLFSKILI